MMTVCKFTHPSVSSKDYKRATYWGIPITQVTIFDIPNTVVGIEEDLYSFYEYSNFVKRFELVDIQKEHNYWLKIYKDGSVTKYATEASAKKYPNKDTVRAIVNIKYKEGDGL